jgi:Zn-dependent protease/predicted transcriptional regulator
MDNSVRIGRVFGVDINIHFTWLIIFGLVVWSLAVGVFPGERPNWGANTYWALAIAAALLFFLSVLIHELSHSLIAISQGNKVAGITLFVFGGVSTITGESRRPVDELVMAAAGPVSSVILAGVFGALASVFGPANDAAAVLFGYLWQINLMLAIFNMVPGFPLDGGRVLRAAIWWVTNDIGRATRLAASVGQAIAYLMMFGGLIVALTGNLISGMWFVFIGWFLNGAAGSSRRETAEQQALRGLRVSDLMSADFTPVGPGISLRQFLNDYLLPYNQRAFPVMVGTQLVGLITDTDLKHAPTDTWDTDTVAQHMTRREALKVARPDEEAHSVLEQLVDLNQLPVVDGERLVGMLSRSNYIRLMRLRQEFGIEPKRRS